MRTLFTDLTPSEQASLAGGGGRVRVRTGDANGGNGGRGGRGGDGAFAQGGNRNGGKISLLNGNAVAIGGGGDGGAGGAGGAGGNTGIIDD